MIEELRITSLGVIDESVLELGPGLSVITGETGAGKTMLVTALGLLLGGRADSGTVRTGARSARVEGRFTVSPELASAVEAAGGEPDDHTVLFVRQVSAEGRSRAFAGGAAVPAGSLSDLTDALVAVHGQSDQHRLLRPEAQRHALDSFAGNAVAEPMAAYTADYTRLRVVERELDDVVRNARERAREADLLRHGLEEIEATDPVPGEDVALAAEEERLGFADTLRTAAEQAREVLSSEDGAPDALAATAAARKQLDDVREHDRQAAALADRLAEVSYLLSDVAADVSSYASALDSDPARLATVSDRRAALTGLTRKYGETIDEVLAWSQQSATRLLELDDTDDRIERLRAERTTLRARLGESAGTVSRGRSEAASRLGAQVSEELTALAMPHAAITVAVTQHDDPGGLTLRAGKQERTVRFGPHGADEVELLLAANLGAEPRPLGKGASGGELSRVMLALEVALAGTSPVPTFVFDEVDAGVGGKAAVEVGRRLAMLARTAQVVVVTHLPQVAAFADRHVVVRKSDDGLVTTSGLTVLDDAERVRELSRMLAGMEESETALAHAEELLAAARDVRG
ncbi:MAG: recombination protein RecN [Nocardioidaceae bacterium]|nr:recombination protein RecN [Nocardioidaceae bacterium]